MSNVSTIELGEIMPAKSGSVDPAKYPDELFELYSIPAFDNRRPEIVPGKSIGSTKQVVEPGDVLLSKIVPHIRRSWIVGRRNGKRIIASGEWIVFRGNQIDPNYLRHVLVGDPFHLQFMSTVSGVGGSLLRARPAYVAKIQIRLPLLAEQRRIAAILDKAEELRAKRRDTLSQLDTVTQAIFLDLFGDPVANAKEWPRLLFGELLEKIDSGWSPICLDRPLIGNEWGVLKLGAVTRCEYKPSENKALLPDVKPDQALEVQPGDLLFTRKNTYELVAACALVRATPPRLMMSDLIFRFRLRSGANMDTCFLHQLLIYPTKRREIQKLAGGSAGSMPNISKTRLLSTPIEIPPLELQREFARRASAVEKLKATHRTSLDELDALFASLQHRAFRGEL